MVLFTRINLSNAIKATNILDFFYNESSLKEKRGKKKNTTEKNLASVLKVNIMLTFSAIHK